MLEEKYKDTLTDLVNEELNSGKVFCFVVSTVSMLPLIKPEDEIVVRKVSKETLKRGDIIVFEKYRELYTHRLLYRRMSDSKIELITKGDNSLIIDEPTSEKGLLGKVIRIKRGNKSINLESKFWKIVNNLTGTLSYLEWTVFSLLRGIKRLILKFE
jgi:signal peptidase I